MTGSRRPVVNGLPCAVFAFNRPQKFRRVIEALRNQRVDKLIVFVDGPRDEKDILLVEQCRSIAREIDWVESELHLSEENHGLNGLADNVTSVLSDYPAAVFVEDDCLPMPAFYAFMRQALTRYYSEDRVFSIGGYQYIHPGYFRAYPYSVVSCARFTCWGWATWRDRWFTILPLIEHYEQLFDSLQFVPEVGGNDLPEVARRMAAGQTVESWDVKVGLASLMLKMVHLLPVKGLIKNIGLDRSGIHRGLMTTIRSRVLHNRNVSKTQLSRIEWLENVELDCEYASTLRRFVRQSQAYSWRRYHSRGRVLMRRYIWPRKERLENLNLTSDKTRPLNRSALLSYITHPFFISREDPRFFRHINIWHAQEIVRVLNRMGYLVDAIDYRDVSFRPRKAYDLFIGHGGVNFEAVGSQLPDRTVKIYFSTGSYWKFHNQQEAARFEALRQRRGFDLPADRLIIKSEEQALHMAQGVIAIGNGVTRASFAPNLNVIMINGTSLYDAHFDWCAKDYRDGRQHFLYYAGPGNVHKGLDLLLEVFRELKQHLWICSPLEHGFAKCYALELAAKDHIHPLGWVQPRSDQFYRVMRRCNFCILPSCSEGQSQSVVEAMNQGVIPVVSRQAGIDVDGYGLYIVPCTIERIREIVDQISEWPLEDCKSRAERARLSVLSDYSEKRFAQSFQVAIETILSLKT